MKLCILSGCFNPRKNRGWCNKHFKRWERNGDPNKIVNSPKGSGYVMPVGYRIITIDGKKILEHRHVMEKHLGRKLLPFPKEVVHHIDENKLNNSIDNLEVLSFTDHNFRHKTKFYRDANKKQCTSCKKIKPRSEFYKNSKNAIDNDPHKIHCKKCSHKKRMFYYHLKKNRELSIRISNSVIPYGRKSDN